MAGLQPSFWAAAKLALLCNLSCASLLSWPSALLRGPARQLQSLYRNDRCAEHCFECWDHGPGNCDVCTDGYKIADENHSSCVAICSANCFNCTAAGPGGCDECEEGFFKTTARCKANPPKHNAAYLEFEDVEPKVGWVRGVVHITTPSKVDFTDYVVFFGTNSTEVKGNSIATVPVAVVNASHGPGNSASVAVPMTRLQGFRPLTHILVFASNQGTMGAAATSLAVRDFFCTENCFSCISAGQDSCDECLPGYFLKPKQQSRHACIPYPPTIEAVSVSFTDQDKDSGQISGTVMIKVPPEETNITHYAIHWARNHGRLDDDGWDTLVGRVPQTGEDVEFILPADTSLPMDAAFLLVVTENGGSAMRTGVAVPIEDVGLLSSSQAMTVAGGLPLDSVSSVSTLGGGHEGSSLSQLNTPADVFVYEKLGIFVADMGNHRVLHFPPGAYSGTSASVVLQSGTQVENLYPTAVQVVDMVAMQAPTSEWLQILSGSQSRSLRVDLLSTPPAPMAVRPPAVVVDAETGADGLNAPEAAQLFEGYLYVADTGNHRVRMFRLPGGTGYTCAGGWGPGDALHQLFNPRHLAVRSDIIGGSRKVLIYIADTLNHRVVMAEQPADFTAERIQTPAQLIAGGNGPGSTSSQLFEPSGIFVTSDGTSVFVADSGNSRVQKWDIPGLSGLTVAGGITAGATAAQLAYPRRVQVLEHIIHRPNENPKTLSTLWVVDSGNHRVQRLPPLMAIASTCTLGRPCELALAVNRPDVKLRMKKEDIVRIVPWSLATWCGGGNVNSSQSSKQSKCGSPAQWKGIENPNRLEESRMRGTAVQRASHFFPAATEGPVGEFRICWGGNVPDSEINACGSTPIDVGILIMHGPREAHAAECTLGVPCGIDLIGIGLQIGNRLALRFIGGGSAKGSNNCDLYRANMTENIWNSVDHWEWPIEDMVPYASAFGQVKGKAHFAFSAGHAGPVGNQYMLCWTEGWPLGIPPDSKVLQYADRGLEYRVRVGTLTIMGPEQGVTMHCWLNEVCTVKLPGVGLARSNGIRLVIDDKDPSVMSCNDFLPLPVPSATVVGLQNPVGANQVESDGSSVKFLLGEPLDDDNLGNYTICWGHSFDVDQNVESYNVQVGTWMLFERPYELRKKRNSIGPITTSDSAGISALAILWFVAAVAFL